MLWFFSVSFVNPGSVNPSRLGFTFNLHLRYVFVGEFQAYWGPHGIET